MFSPEANAYTEILKTRYPGMYSYYQFIEANSAGGVPVVCTHIYDLIDNYYVNNRSEYMWKKGSTRSISEVKVDQTFAPIGTDSAWGELYVIHGNGLGAYYYAVDNHNTVENDKLCWDNDNYHVRETAATEALWNNLYDACGGFQNYAATLANKVYVNMERIGTWNGLSINRVFFEQWTDTNPRPW